MTELYSVPFISVEDGDDLILSFPLGDEVDDSSLVLLRTPKYEVLLDPDERGVSVGTGDVDEDERELLVSVDWKRTLVQVVSTVREFNLNLSRVDPAEITEAKKILRKMNFDKRFKFNDA